MPIRAEKQGALSEGLAARSAAESGTTTGNCCRDPAFPDCRAEPASLIQLQALGWVLTVAPRPSAGGTWTTTNRAWCQKCLNTLDLPMRRAGINDRARKQRADGDLFP